MTPRINPVPASGNGERVQELLDLSIAGVGGGQNLFRTLARNPGLFHRYLAFSSRLFEGRLSDRVRELVILRVAALCGSTYEWGQHVRIGLTAGLTRAEIDRVIEGPEAGAWPDEDRVVLKAVDQMVTDRHVDGATWASLAARWGEPLLIEFSFLVGHYVMLAGVIATLQIESEPGLEDLPSHRIA